MIQRSPRLASAHPQLSSKNQKRLAGDCSAVYIGTGIAYKQPDRPRRPISRRGRNRMPAKKSPKKSSKNVKKSKKLGTIKPLSKHIFSVG
jgi:hypothetical protein